MNVYNYTSRHCTITDLLSINISYIQKRFFFQICHDSYENNINMLLKKEFFEEK